jgi:hypothetical protein
MARKKEKGGTSAKAPTPGKVESNLEANLVDRDSLPEGIDPGATVEVHVDVPTRERYAAAITSVCRMGGLAAGRLLIDAKENLKHGDFEDMIERDLPFGPRTAERLMIVARNEVLSNPTHASLLPGAWTVLHELALVDEKLDAPGTLKEWVETGVVHPKIKREEVKTLVEDAIALKDESDAVGPDVEAADTPPPSSEDPPPLDDVDVAPPDAAPPPRPPRPKPPKPPKPDRDDVGENSAGEAARLRVDNERLHDEKRRLEIKINGLESELAEAKAGAGLDDDVRDFVNDLIARVADMAAEQREELFRMLREFLTDLPTSSTDDGLREAS